MNGHRSQEYRHVMIVVAVLQSDPMTSTHLSEVMRLLARTGMTEAVVLTDLAELMHRNIIRVTGDASGPVYDVTEHGYKWAVDEITRLTAANPAFRAVMSGRCLDLACAVQQCRNMLSAFTLRDRLSRSTGTDTGATQGS